MIQVSGHSVPPIKGCRGTNLETVKRKGRGRAFDPRFMIPQPAVEFLPQRQDPGLALTGPGAQAAGLACQLRGS